MQTAAIIDDLIARRDAEIAQLHAVLRTVRIYIADSPIAHALVPRGEGPSDWPTLIKVIDEALEQKAGTE